MPKSVYFKNILCDNEKRYRIQTVWNENNFILIVIEDFKAYKSNVSQVVLKRLAKKYDSVFESYVEEIRNSLSKDLENITFKRNENTFTISRKQDSISVQFADFVLEEIDFNNAAIHIMDENHTSSQFYQNEANKSKGEMEAAVEEKNKYVDKLEKFVNKKKDMEHELYSKFILILNEKKSRIQYLQELLEKLKEEKGQLDNKVLEEFEMNGTKREIISNSDSDTSSDEPAEKIVHKVEINEITQKKKSNFFDDDSITVKSLPKRIKTIGCSVPTENITDAIESTTANDKSPEIAIEAAGTKKEDSQDSLNFNTQDLFDRF